MYSASFSALTSQGDFCDPSRNAGTGSPLYGSGALGLGWRHPEVGCATLDGDLPGAKLG